MREAAARAQLNLAASDDESLKADSLAVMEEAMTFFYRIALRERRRGEKADFEVIRDNFHETVAIAKEVAPYRHARLSSVKVGGDKAKPLHVPMGSVEKDIWAELIADIARTGVLPGEIMEMLGQPSVVTRVRQLLGQPQAAVRRGDNGAGHRENGSAASTSRGV